MTTAERADLRTALALSARERLEARKQEAERPYLVCCCGEPAASVNEVLFCKHGEDGR